LSFFSFLGLSDGEAILLLGKEWQKYVWSC
jgi:hypothetical protein